MHPEPPIFILSQDNAVLDVRLDVEDAEEHAGSTEHATRGRPGANLLYFDGLARPLDVREAGRGFRLTVASATSDPWQVRARAVEAIRRRKAWVAAQTEMFEVGGKRVSPEAAQAEMQSLDDVSLDSSFAEFTQGLLLAFTAQRHSGSFLHNLFHK